MNKPLLTTILAVVGFLVVALLTSVIYVSTESKREGLNYSNTRMKHTYSDKASPEEVYDFLDEAAHTAEDDKDFSATNAILATMQGMAAKKSTSDKQYFDLVTRRGELYLYKMDDAKNALPLLKEAYVLIKTTPGLTDTIKVEAKANLGNAQNKSGDNTNAVKLLKEAYEDALKLTNNGQKGRIAYNLSSALCDDHKYEEAATCGQASLKFYEQDATTKKFDLAEGYQQLGIIQHALHQDDLAIANLEKALLLYKEDGTKDAEIITSLKHTGWIELAAGHKERAKELFNRVIESSESEDTTAEGFILRRL